MNEKEKLLIELSLDQIDSNLVQIKPDDYPSQQALKEALESTRKLRNAVKEND